MLWYDMVWNAKWESMRFYAMVWHSNGMIWDLTVILSD